jgi:hypothetical protein
MTRETLYTIRKFLVTARVSRPEEDEFFTVLRALDRLIVEDAKTFQMAGSSLD